MSIAFDRAAPGEGVETFFRLETGKVYFEWQLHYTEQPGRESVHIWLRDGRQETVLECLGLAAEEEPLQAVLLQPHLWNGCPDPYLYTLEAVLADSEGVCVDRVCQSLPLRSLELKGDGGVFLNGASLELKTVRYEFPANVPEIMCQRIVTEDIQKLLLLGANSIYTEQKKGLTKPFLQLCGKAGILVLTDASYIKGDKYTGSLSKLPALRGKEPGPLLSESGQPTSEFYRYRAMWSQEPFVYLVPESIRRQKNGSFCAAVYSSCRRIALYSDGVLFEFQSGQGKFVFCEIPAKGPCVSLTVEGDGCSEAFSIHKTFTKLSLNGDI